MVSYIFPDLGALALNHALVGLGERALEHVSAKEVKRYA